MDSPALQVDRISLSTLSKQSWFDNMIVEVRPWFDFYPNSHNVYWSIRPEQKNTDDGTLFLEGATEPIFMPIVISKKGGN